MIRRFLGKLYGFIRGRGFLSFIFIGFNLLYFMLLGFGPLLRGSFAVTSMSFNLSLPLNVLFVLPVISIVLFSRKFIRKDANQIGRLFFGFELPVFSLCFVRIVGLKDITPIYLFILVSISIGMIGFLSDMLGYGKKTDKGKIVLTLAYEVIIIIGGYLSLLAMFFVLPMFAGFITGIFKGLWNFSISGIFEFFSDRPFFEALYLLGLILFFLTAFMLVLITPIISFVIYLKTFVKQVKELNKPVLLSIFAAVYVLCGIGLSMPFNNAAFQSRLAVYKEEKDFYKKQELARYFLNKEESIKAGLTDNYLADMRYIMTDLNYSGIERLYVRELKFNRFLAEKVQWIYGKLARPFIYQGDYSNIRSANADYQALFDENIQYAERKAVKSAVEATFFRTQLSASLLDLDEKNVFLTEKDVQVTHEKDSPAAKVVITETYENKTKRDKEVYYEFSLSSGAVITGLKLGNELQYSGVIAPKGAARKTYEAQIRYAQDPALLEKAGPRQYTLRVFPVTPSEPQKVQYEYISPIKDGWVELPYIYQARNVYSNKKTSYSYTLNGEEVAMEFPNSFRVKQEGKYQPQYVEYENGYYHLVEKGNVSYDRLKDLKVGVLLDISYSNPNVWTEDDDVKDISSFGADFYFFNDLITPEPVDLFSTEQINFGPTKRLNAVNELNWKYDVILMFTDSSVFDLSDKRIQDISSPVYLIHKSGFVPPYYNELTKTILKSNGGVAYSLDEAFQDFLYKQQPGVIATDDVYVWMKSDAPMGNAVPVKDKAVQKLIVAKIIEDVTRMNTTQDMAALERLHVLAIQNGIVTDFSSYLALVTDVQKKLLSDLEKGTDKFKADLNIGEEGNLSRGKVMDTFSVEQPMDTFSANQSNDTFSAVQMKGIPEPEEWAMIFIGLGLILFTFRKKIRQCFCFKHFS